MKYVSNDGILFDTEHECLEHENMLKKQREEEQRVIEEERKRVEENKKRQTERYNNIVKHHKELMEEIKNYEKDYNSRVFGGFFSDGMTNLVYELFK